MALRDFPLPGILYFTSGNPFSGSYKGLNYRVDPVKAKAEEDISAHFAVCTWTGEKCSELSEMRSTIEFPLDVDGLVATENWLREQYQEFAKEQ